MNVKNMLLSKETNCFNEFGFSLSVFWYFDYSDIALKKETPRQINSVFNADFILD